MDPQAEEVKGQVSQGGRAVLAQHTDPVLPAPPSSCCAGAGPEGGFWQLPKGSPAMVKVPRGGMNGGAGARVKPLVNS